MLSSRSQKRSSSVYDGRMSFSSDTSTLLNVELPSYYPTYSPPKYVQVIEEEMLDPEDQAWGSPPATNLKWLRLSRKSKSKSKSS
ncbi:hypothetical protein D9613_004371 [Agrocybe pediades]|uniref:Uncharacterized protein n=1 Tax=Agrocybe pediades TaxID=84607 RepID=A0A8H4VLH5_9AGAR|nr:hypothetical protein D9613_004371 [Agrocybe pediades]